MEMWEIWEAFSQLADALVTEHFEAALAVTHGHVGTAVGAANPSVVGHFQLSAEHRRKRNTQQSAAAAPHHHRQYDSVSPGRGGVKSVRW